MTAFTPQNAATELENLVTDVRGMLASKDLDAVPQIKALRKRIDESVVVVRETAVEAAQEAAEDADDDVEDDALRAIALHHDAGEPACDAADDQVNEKVHGAGLLENAGMTRKGRWTSRRPSTWGARGGRSLRALA